MLKKTLIVLILSSFVIAVQPPAQEDNLSRYLPHGLTRPTACDPIRGELLHQDLLRLEQSLSHTRQLPLVNKPLFSPKLSTQGKEPRWRSLGPHGGYVIGMAANPQEPTEMFCLAGISSSGYCQLYITSNAGKKWNRRVVLNREGYDFAMDPKDSAILYVLTYDSLLKSKDSGITWDEIKFDNRFRGYYGKICIHPFKPKFIYLGGRAYSSGYGISRIAVCKTRNAGRTWEVQELDASATSGYVTCMAIDPLFPQILYAGGRIVINGRYKYMLYKTTDGGKKWASLDARLQFLPRCIAVDPNNSHRLYVASSWGVNRSSDQGDTWQMSQGSVAGYTVAVSPLNPEEVYAGDDGCIYKSTDGGVSWTRHAGGLLGFSTQLFLLDQKLFYVSSAGIFRSTDSGLSWITSHKGIRADRIPVISMASASPQVMYTEAADNAMFRSAKSGQNWKRLPYFERCDDIVNICINPSDADDLFILVGG